MKRRLGRPHVLAATTLLIAIVGLMSGMHSATAEQTPAGHQYQGTLVQQRADSQIMKHTDGYYYFTGTVPEYDRIVLRRAKTLEGLASAPESVIWRKHASGEMSFHIWAPEIQFINGKWYVYFAASRANAIWDIRMYVLEGAGDNPFTATWTEKGPITTGISDEIFALDATTFVDEYDPKKTRYLSWAQRQPANEGKGTSIYIAELGKNPWEITGKPVKISSPELPWEIQRYEVNEGPAVIQRNGRTFLTYSASATDTRYCMGMLTAKEGANLLDVKSWEKSKDPVFKSSEATGQYGPGHNSFVVAEDGKTDILVYHDRNYSFKDEDRNALNDVNRRTRIQKFTWNDDGSPNFGVPVADAEPVQIRLHSAPELYVRHYAYRARLEANVTPKADSQFRVVPGLAGGESVSLESSNFPHYYLRDLNGEAWVKDAESNEAYGTAASFFVRTGLSGTGVSFEAVGQPAGRYLRKEADNLLSVRTVVTTADKADATFDFSPTPAALPAVDPQPSPSSSDSASPGPTPSASSVSATPGPQPTTTGAPDPGAGGGGLPVTGPQIAQMAGLGVVALAGGILLYVLTRRRRTEFSTDQD
jgi:GH43 family beta-xylosidase